MNDPIKIGIVGLGKIARDQHLPAIANNPAFELTATASLEGGVEFVPCYRSLGEMIAAADLHAVAICTPPAIRHALALEAIAAGLHVLLEKPPAVTLSDAVELTARAEAASTALFAAWHSREAAAVDAAKAALADRAIKSVAIEWKEDIRRWHPGQEWILGEGGFGVFDPGINALSVLTAIVGDAVRVERAVLYVPIGRAAPIAAQIDMRLPTGAPVSADFDFLQTGEQAWNIHIQTDRGDLTLADGGATLLLEGTKKRGADQEYARLYERFAALITNCQRDVDIRPLALVADALRLAEVRPVPPFDFD